ncbi:hypothetical protein DRF65_27865 [Chryseobacterium pennae]|uniref:Uncharacterized protein n=1 Tax=Chryseobacterium pennae TaxID=2258962 RepID=A0A3D9C035_9FLAO|nr:hypothetical protein [Chryseobacterium pennae]REC59079.1 hypothetical protein DRF65_27865 [Chryseobacterium pennae]
MDKSLDLFRYNEEMISIKDMENDLNISQMKWDDIFKYFLINTSYVYFLGFKRWIEDENFINTMNSISDRILVNIGNDSRIILCKLKVSTLINRSLLNRMFYYYEFPTLVFIKNIEQEQEIINYTEKLPLGDIPLTNLSYLYIVSKESQPDVLWLRKSSNMDFPWETMRSTLALKEELTRPWYKKLLNSLGFDGDIKINKD